jgi:hypothetical protein
MAATTYDQSDIDAKVAAKREVWNRLQQMYTTKTGSVDVAIELNPYFRVIDAATPKLELEYCNVFFRQAHGAYVPYVGPLKLDSDKKLSP